ncbi:acyl carrier protein [Streptomyces cyaneofuscatus]|uniref:acyl carrier protein n=1 Tax=Streptomyces cyaneofuscatus TaxID=66883 RepID=UPI00365FE21B
MVAEPTETLAPQRTRPAPGEDRRAARVCDPDGAEQILAAVLADVCHIDDVPADSDFFADLGADSLVTWARSTSAVPRPAG